MKPFLLVFRCDKVLRLQDAVQFLGVKVKSSQYHCNRLTAGSDSGAYGTDSASRV